MGLCASNSVSADIRQQYDVKEVIKSSGYITNRRAIKKSDGKEYLIKIVKISKFHEDEVTALEDEIKILKSIRHDNCLRMYEDFGDEGSTRYMVMEYLSGPELFDQIVEKGSYTEELASDALRCIASGLAYLHSIGIVHRDLKPENILYENPTPKARLKIIDFGIARMGADEEHFHTACGTPGYVSPEVLKNEDYGMEVDCWSLGVILYILLCGFPPFFHDTAAGLYKLIKEGKYDFPDEYWKDITDSAKDLVRCLLVVDKTKRYTAVQVLQHPWVCQGLASPRKLGAKFQNNIHLIQLKTKFRVKIRTIIAINRIARELRKIVDACNE